MKSVGYGGWKVLLLVSVILPMGLLTSFKLAGIVGQQTNIAQTITANNTLYWSAERPDIFMAIRDNLTSYYQSEIDLVQQVVIEDYYDTSNNWFTSDYVSLAVEVNATVQSGYVYEVNLTVNPDSEIALIGLTYARHENLSAIQFGSIGGTTSEDVCVGMGYPHQTYFELPLQWQFLHPHNQTETLLLTSEVVYYNGTVFKSVVQDFLLKLEPRCNNTFATAVELQQGNYTRLYLGGQPESAYYKIYADNSQRIAFDIKGQWPIFMNFDVSIYNPNGTLAMPTETSVQQYSADFLANATGYWVIHIAPDQGQYGFYSIEVGSS